MIYFIEQKKISNDCNTQIEWYRLETKSIEQLYPLLLHCFIQIYPPIHRPADRLNNPFLDPLFIILVDRRNSAISIHLPSSHDRISNDADSQYHLD